jgi:hypothetical protein
MYKDTLIATEMPEMLQYLSMWGTNATRLRYIHIFLGTFATFFALLAAADFNQNQNGYAGVFAFIAAVSISLLTAFNLGAKSNNVRNAWRHLNAAVIKFNRKLVDKGYVIAAYEKACLITRFYEKDKYVSKKSEIPISFPV